MIFKDLKATIYDYFGYFLPGVVLIILGYCSWLHSIGVTNIYTNILKIIHNLNAVEVFLLICVCYFLGQATSSISSFIIEKIMFPRLKIMNTRFTLEKILSPSRKEAFLSKYENKFLCKYNDKDFRTVICYVESYQSHVYSTAFVFLTIYGMARSIALEMTFLFIWEVSNILIFHMLSSINYAFCYFILMLAFYYQYYKFYRYFKDQIISGFLLPSKKK